MSRFLEKVVEIARFEEVLSHVGTSSGEEVVVVFDIDNTLLKSSQQLGTVAWFSHLMADIERKGASKGDAESVVSIYWQMVLPHLKVEPIDPDAPKVVKKLQEKKILVVGLTARVAEEAEYTRKHLLSIGVDLANSFPLEEFALKHKALYEHGVLFASPRNKKSELLLAFLKRNSLKPKRIIFMDDIIDNVYDVKGAFRASRIECVGLRFSGSDEHVRKFDSKIADLQWKAFPRFLSDEDAIKESHQSGLENR